jgi:hypothetical protein
MTNSRNEEGSASNVLLIFGLIVVLPLLAYIFAQSVKDTNAARESCEATNVLRSVQQSALDTAVKRAIDDGDLVHETEFRNARKELVSAAKNTDNQLRPHSAELDCVAQFPKPWPFD